MGHPPFSACFQVRDTGDLPLNLLYSLSLLIIQILLSPGQGVSFSAFDQKLYAGWETSPRESFISSTHIKESLPF